MHIQLLLINTCEQLFLFQCVYCSGELITNAKKANKKGTMLYKAKCMSVKELIYRDTNFDKYVGRSSGLTDVE